MSFPKSALVLLSGGVDSIALCRWVLASPVYNLAACLTVDYGQPAADEESSTAARWCYLNGVAHLIRSAQDLDSSALQVGGETGPRVVPGRNAFLLALAVNVAPRVEANVVMLGATGSDRVAYPDCRGGFFRELSEVFRKAYGVEVKAPLQGMEKSEVVSYLSPEDRALSFSCYTPAGRMRHCGRCRSCLERAEALGS